jgi:hypothetical protein
MTATDRTAFITGLRMLADALDRNPAIPLPHEGRSATSPLDFGLLHQVSSGEDFAAVVRSLGGTRWQQQIRRSADGAYTWLDVTGRIAGLWVKVGATADRVCEPVPPQPVIKRTCPALDAVIAEAGTGCAS